MKKARIFTLLALIAILSVCIFVGCGKKGDTVSSVSLKDNDPNTAIEVALGDFEISTYTVIVTYESGSIEEIPLTEEMINETDLFKLYQIGDHDITFSYGEQKYTFKVSVKRATFGELSFSGNNVFTYDGKAHTVEVDGEIPANAVVTYIGGNSFVNAGTYDVTAVVSCEGFVTQRLSTTVTVNRATYDMTGVKFEDKEVVYDGNTHTLVISGMLPEGVSSPKYSIKDKIASNATDVGEYTVKATFTNDDPNYEPIPEMEATLRITPAEYTVKNVDIIFKNENGNVLSDANKIYDGKRVMFDLDNYDRLPKQISVLFSVYDQNGKLIASSNKNTGIIDAGRYTVKAELSLENGKNYKPIEPIVRTFDVLKADYPSLGGIYFGSAQAAYDGKAHSIAIEGKLPADVTVSYEYYLNDELIVDGKGTPVQSVTDAGRYTVKAIFAHSDKNCNPIPSISATLNIEPTQINPLTIGIEYSATWVYDGTAKSVKVTRKPDYIDVSCEYYLDGVLVTNSDGTPATSVTSIGDYTAIVTFNVKNNNYAPMDPLTLTFSIVAPTN